MCEHILIRKVSMTLIACYTSAVHRIVMNGLILCIMVNDRGLGNPVMGVLRLASSATIARPTVGAGVSTTTGTAVAATGLGLGRARVPA